MFGLLNINKPAGWTSRDVVNRVQRIVRPVKTGHAGTLDPLATGVLIVPVGRATRLTEYIHTVSKTYVAKFELGKTSDTEVQSMVLRPGTTSSGRNEKLIPKTQTPSIRAGKNSRLTNEPRTKSTTVTQRSQKCPMN